MRISGTYYERLINIWMLYGVFISVILLLSIPSNILLLLALIVVILVIWMIECACISRLNLKALYVADVIYIGDVRVLPKDIIRITPITRNAGRLDFKTIEFTFTNNGNVQKLSVLAKPVRIFRDSQSRTYTLLFENFPQLKRKFRSVTI